MVKVKICGITTIEDALAAAQAGADMLGLNLYRNSPRFIEVESAVAMAARLRVELGAARPLLVGLFVNEIVGRISITMEQVGLHVAQLSGDESADLLREMHGVGYKAIRPRNLQEAVDDAAYFAPHSPSDVRFPSLLLDAYHPDLYGGTGQQASIEVARAVMERTPRLMLAGGLTPENVGDRVAAIQPWAVDVASGVEADGQPGKKDLGKLRAFIQAAKGLS
ncbi:MAG: phosphoribosylanthranilate isomerase [Chloroflexota bacterium]|nr:phosphoribosylanthranilate isomerase [Chloroflexota bacterium]